MARGKSGRVVLEIDPELKKNLYLALEKRQKTLKDWFVSEAEGLIFNGDQIKLFDTDLIHEEKSTGMQKATNKNRKK